MEPPATAQPLAPLPGAQVPLPGAPNSPGVLLKSSSNRERRRSTLLKEMAQANVQSIGFIREWKKGFETTHGRVAGAGWAAMNQDNALLQDPLERGAKHDLGV